MNRTVTVLILLFVYLSGYQHIAAQEVSDYSKLTPEDYAQIGLPSIDLLFENAKNGPTYELGIVKEDLEKNLLKKEKKDWLKFFSIKGSYQYGMFGNESTYTDVYTPAFYNYSTAAQNGYTIGAGISIPLDGLFDIRGRVKRQKLNIRSAELEKEQKFEEVKKEIIQLYVTATAQLNVMKIRAESVILANTQYSIAEKDFTNGTLDSGALSQEKERQSQALERYENSKSELNKSLMILEMITYTPIINK